MNVKNITSNLNLGKSLRNLWENLSQLWSNFLDTINLPILKSREERAREKRAKRVKKDLNDLLALVEEWSKIEYTEEEEKAWERVFERLNRE